MNLDALRPLYLSAGMALVAWMREQEQEAARARQRWSDRIRVFENLLDLAEHPEHYDLDRASLRDVAFGRVGAAPSAPPLDSTQLPAPRCTCSPVLNVAAPDHAHAQACPSRALRCPSGPIVHRPGHLAKTCPACRAALGIMNAEDPRVHVVDSAENLELDTHGGATVRPLHGPRRGPPFDGGQNGGGFFS